jgi:outer membrane receptor protein involved in Fe transport
MTHKRISTFVGATTLFTALLVASTADAGDLNARASQPSQNAPPQQSAAPSGASASAKEDKQDTSLVEIIVSAQKRDERLQDVPIPVSVIGSAALVQSNQVKFTDYYTEVPGLSVAPGPTSTNTLSIRGISTGANASGPPAPAPTVGIVIDDVPFGGTGGGDTLVPDFDPGDLARIEVLRGPQGTLYGASSLGGLIKFVTVDPSTDGVSGRLEAGTNSVHNGAEPGYTFRGSVNVPISSDLAIRASAFTRQDAGYINDPVLGIKGINEDHTSGGHFVALWRPSDALSLKVNALYQKVTSNGSSDVTPNPPAVFGVPALGDLQQSYPRGTSFNNTESQAYSAKLTYKVGSAELTSLTGYNRFIAHDSYDFAWVIGPLTEQYFGVVGTPERVLAAISRVTQELRLAVPIGQQFDLLFGGFYSHSVDKYRFGPFLATNPTTGVAVGDWGDINATAAPTDYTEYAVFADVTYHITDRIDVQMGGRESVYELDGKPWTDTGLFSTVVLGFPTQNFVAFPEYNIKQNAFTYLFTPRFKITPDLMTYARLASGYRQGGTNAGTPGVPFVVNPDKTQDYEVGLKGEFFDHALSVDSSVYYVKWKNIQIPLLNPGGISYTGNGGAAKSQGVELSVNSRPTPGLTLAAWVDWDEAVLTQGVPSIFSGPGARLPDTPRFSGNASVNEEFTIVNGLKGFVGGAISYVGNRLDTFAVTGPQRQYLPAYAKTDLRAGAKFDAWAVNFYVNNVTDKRGVITGGTGNVVPYSFFLIQPRTVGLSVSTDFGKH